MNSTDPIVSIVIPTFNASATLREALKSILDQTYIDWEALIMDGASSDVTAHVAGEFTRLDDRIMFFSESDKGIYDAMNKGIRKARGVWILFLGADDTLYDNKVLERVAKRLDSNVADFFYGDVEVVGDNTWAKDGEVYDGPFTIEKLFDKNICHQSIFYSKAIFGKLGAFESTYKLCADWDFNHRCFAKARTKYIGEIVSRFNAGGESTLKAEDKFTLEDAAINLQKYYKISLANKLFAKYSWVFIKNAEASFSKKRFFKGVQLFVMAFYHSKNKKRLLHYLLRKTKREV